MKCTLHRIISGDTDLRYLPRLHLINKVRKCKLHPMNLNVPDSATGTGFEGTTVTGMSESMLRGGSGYTYLGAALLCSSSCLFKLLLCPHFVNIHSMGLQASGTIACEHMRSIMMLLLELSVLVVAAWQVQLPIALSESTSTASHGGLGKGYR